MLLHSCAKVKNPYESSTLLIEGEVTHKVIHRMCVELTLR